MQLINVEIKYIYLKSNEPQHMLLTCIEVSFALRLHAINLSSLVRMSEHFLSTTKLSSWNNILKFKLNMASTSHAASNNYKAM